MYVEKRFIGKRRARIVAIKMYFVKTQSCQNTCLIKTI